MMDVSAWSHVHLDARLGGGHRNEVWSGWAADERVAVRRSRRAPASLAWELDLLVALDDAGFLVPVPLTTDQGARSADGVVVQRWIDGRQPTTADDWELVTAELRRLHGQFASHPQRPGCRAVIELDPTARSVDADLSVLPDDVLADVLAAFASLRRRTVDVESGAPQDPAVSVIHGDPGPSNLRITPDGRVGLLDVDESRVDVIDLDLANLGLQVLPDADHASARRAADAWETVNAWTTEPEYARRRLAALRADRRQATTEPGGRSSSTARSRTAPSGS